MSSDETRMMVAAGWLERRRRAVSNPSIPGIRTSTRTSAGASSATTPSAASPDAASPRSSKPGVASITSRMLRRNPSWSSTVTTPTDERPRSGSPAIRANHGGSGGPSQCGRLVSGGAGAHTRRGEVCTVRAPSGDYRDRCVRPGRDRRRQPVVREGLEHVLQGQGAIDVVASCEDLPSLLEAVESTQPDVVLTDIRMPPSGATRAFRPPPRFATAIRASASSSSASTRSRPTRSRSSRPAPTVAATC